MARLLTIVALYLLLLLIYSTITQMRPTEVIRAIHDHTLAARKRQQRLLQRTRRQSQFSSEIDLPVRVEHEGFFVALNLDALAREIDNASETVEVVLQVPIGSYVAFQDTIASVRADNRDDAEQIANTIRQAVLIQRRRQLADDPAYGIQQLETIAWRSISTSQQNPAPGLVVIQNLRDILARWSVEDGDDPDQDRLPIVYPDDVATRLLGAFESLAIVASESMQHQTYAEIVRSFAITLDRLPHHLRRQSADLLLRTLSALGDHVLTTELEDALTKLEEALERVGLTATAVDVRAAHGELATTIGKLNSRATRVPSAL